MKFEQSKPHRRIAGKGILVHLQKGHVFHGDVHVGPEPEGSGSMTPWQLLDAAKVLPKPEPVKKANVEKKVEKKVKKAPVKKAGLYLGVKPKRKAVRRVVGKV